MKPYFFNRISPQDKKLSGIVDYYQIMEVDTNNIFTSVVCYPNPASGLIFHYKIDGILNAEIHESKLRMPFCFVYPPASSPYFINLMGKTGYIAVFFKLGVFSKIFKLNMMQFTDRFAELDSAFDNLSQIKTKELLRVLEKQLNQATDNYKRIKYIEKFLLEILKDAVVPRSTIVEQTIYELQSCFGNLDCLRPGTKDFKFDVNYLNDRLKTRPTDLSTEIKENLGFKPVEFLRIVKLNNLTHYLLKYFEKGLKASDLPYEFFDFSSRSHFGDRFKKHTGTSPDKFLDQAHHRALDILFPKL